MPDKQQQLLLKETSRTELRQVSCWALGGFAGVCPASVDWRDLLALAEGDASAPVRFEAVAALGKLARCEPDSWLFEALSARLDDSCARVRFAAASPAMPPCVGWAPCWWRKRTSPRDLLARTAG